MSWKPYFILKGELNPDGTPKHSYNGQAFATKEEALDSAYSRFMRWTAPIDYGADESTEPVNYRWDPEHGDVHIASTTVVPGGAP